MKNLFIILFSSLFLISCSSAKKLNRQLNQQFKAEVFVQSFTGFMIYDPVKKKTLYDFNSQKYFTPASNIKLLTFYAGLKVLEDSIPALKYVVKNDSLVFWGTGDPSFLYSELPESKVLSFLKNRKENLYYLPPVFTEEHFGPGWAWDDYNAYYSVERSAFPIYGNYAVFEFFPGDSIPVSLPGSFKRNLIPGQENSNRIRRSLEKNTFLYKPFTGSEGFTQIVPFKTSDELFAELLSDTLQKPIEILKIRPEDLSETKTVFSIASDSLYKQMLQQSDNFLAEQTLLMVAGKISDSLKTDIAISHILEQHLNDLPDKPNWVDGSGLSRYNLITPRNMVFLLQEIAEIVPSQRLFSLLPAGGRSGTLQNSYLAKEPYIFSKTGTLRNNHALSGFLKTKSGKILIFSFMNNNYPNSSAEIKKQMEIILKGIHENY
ncbi:D-alanyl-D-alanine carboxypeptidase/D-alanyl-D-alanine-endopeptidase [Gillisia sp. Q332]|uniref:D-alanyl-D-alanine carboxypeptidase/D-alanyl-D-alanine-endopeptidase n=1 Tax=Gillisia xinjiangensis TaxID=3384765 RepID=UPI00391DB66B